MYYDGKIILLCIVNIWYESSLEGYLDEVSVKYEVVFVMI